MKHRYKPGALCKCNCLDCKFSNEPLQMKIVKYHFNDDNKVIYRVKKLYLPSNSKYYVSTYPAEWLRLG